MNLQENIHRIKEVMGVLMEDDKKYLYHGTSYDNAINIIDNGFDENTYWGDKSTAEQYAYSYDNPVLIKVEINQIYDLLEPNYTLISYYEENMEDDEYKDIIDLWNESDGTIEDSLNIFDSVILPPTYLQLSKENIMNLQENIHRIKEVMGIINEIRVPRDERVELYKDDNIIVVVPLTHRALQKYANSCQWCINSDEGEWGDYHKGMHCVIIQRNPRKVKMGITGNPTPSEIFLLAKWDNNESSFEDVCQMLNYEFRNDRTMSDYYVTISNDLNNFGTNIVYYSPENGIYDQEDNFLWNFDYEISDIPNVTPEVIKIMDDYLKTEDLT
jgi:hypothetical protein